MRHAPRRALHAMMGKKMTPERHAMICSLDDIISRRFPQAGSLSRCMPSQDVAMIRLGHGQLARRAAFPAAFTTRHAAWP